SAPAFAKPSTIALPSPRLPPVTSATFPARTLSDIGSPSGTHPAQPRAVHLVGDDFVGTARKLHQQRPRLARVDDLFHPEDLRRQDRIAQGSELLLQLLAQLVGIIG